jgi:hypothetical protein
MNDETPKQKAKNSLSRLYLETKLDELFVAADEVSFASDTGLSTSLRLTGGQDGDLRPCLVVTFTFRGDSTSHIANLKELAGKMMAAYAEDMERFDDQPNMNNDDQ